jgi:8-oxo-dGTP diphosphatase
MVNQEDIIPVTAAVIVKDGKVLIARRRRAVMGYSWEFPGGKLEDGETLEECLKREIGEELGIVIEVGEKLCASTHALNCRTTIRLFAFMATHVSGEFRLSDHEEVRWVTPAELDAYAFPEPDRPIVAALKRKGVR